MKRQGYLIQKIAEHDNLQLAYYKAKKGKADRKEVIEYGKHLGENLSRLRQHIVSGRVEIGNYHYFTVYDPKKRKICAAPFEQRILHHALMNVCHPFFETAQIYHNYASRVGKGTYAALEQAKKYQQRYQWFLKLDFKKYFDSLDHEVLKIQLKRLFKDSRLLDIFNSIIDSYDTGHKRGVPIGNLTSQYFANHYLAGADHYIKEVLRIPAYIRYMDDLVLWHHKKDNLLVAGRRFREYTEMNLKLTLKPDCFNRNLHGLPFLGYLIYPNNVRLKHRSRIRFINKIKNFESNLKTEFWSQQDFQNHVLPLIAFTEFANSKAFRKKVIFTIR